MCCVSGEEPFHMHPTNNSFCQIAQCREKNHQDLHYRKSINVTNKVENSGHYPHFRTFSAIAQCSLARTSAEEVEEFNSGCITIVHKCQPPFFPGFYIRYPDVVAMDKCNPIWISWTKLGIHPDIWTTGLYQNGS